MSASFSYRRLLIWGAPVVLLVAASVGLLTAGGDVPSQEAMAPGDREINFPYVPSPSYSPRVAQVPTGPLGGGDIAAAPGPAPTASTSVLKVYGCAPGNAPVVAAQLAEQHRGNPNVRIVPDGRTSQVLVMAPPTVQAQIAGHLPEDRPAKAVRPSPSVPTPAASVQSPQATPGGPVNSQEVQLWHTTGQQFEAELVRMLSDRLTPLAGSHPEASDYELTLANRRSLRLSIHRGLNRVHFTGDPSALASCAQLIHVMDAPELPAERSMRLVSLKEARSPDVRRVVDAVRGGPASAAPRQEGVRLAMAAQPAEQAPASQAAAAPDTAAVVAAPEGLTDSSGLLGSVQVEILPGTDIMVIRGHERDVQTVVDLIEQIEQISVEAEPAVEVYPLVHVDCLPLATLLGELYEEVYSARQGSVSITALVKPNSLLLIGREESVKTVVDLIGRLDHPVPPSTQFEAFRLKNTPAETAMETIEEFFTDRYDDEEGGLGARVQLTDDFRTNSLFVWASPRDLAEVAAIIARLDGKESDSFNQVQIFRLKNSLAAELAPVLQDAITGQMYGQRTGQRAVFQRAGTGEQFERKSIRLQFVTGDDQDGRLLDSGILTDAQVTADERANALIVTASAESMPLIAALIKELDSLPTAEAMVKVFTVFHSDASNLMDMLDDLFGAQTQSDDLAVRTGAGGEDSSLVSLRFAVDVRSNSIIATGSAGDLEVVESILARLDESDLRERQTVVISLKNASADPVAAAVNDFITQELAAQMEPDDGLLSSIEQIDRMVVVVPEVVTNSLILSATDQYFSRIVDLIEKLDARPPMVLIQVLIAAVRLDTTDEFGVELGLQDSILFDRSLNGLPGFLFNSIDSLGNNTSANNTQSVAGQSISNFSLGRSNSELGYGGLVLSASSESVSVLIRALQEEQRAEILGRPQIMTTDMVQAHILVGERVRIPTTTSSTNSGQVNLGTEEEEVGLSLLVTPRVTPDGQVIMEILTSRSRLGDEEDGTVIAIDDDGQAFRSPRIEIAETETTVSAMDGQTVILGGLITKDTLELHRQVPYLGDIPVLGHLFRFDSVEEIREELLIILTPHIVESAEDLELVKQTEAARIDWCYGDVLKVHGDMFDSSDQTPVIYPDLDPAARAMATPDPIPELQNGPSPFVVEPPPPDPAGAAQTPKLPGPPPPRAQGAATAPGSTQATARRTGQPRQDGPILPSLGLPRPPPRPTLPNVEQADYELRFMPSAEVTPTSWTLR